jgi:CYTH domain-containing protein
MAKTPIPPKKGVKKTPLAKAPAPGVELHKDWSECERKFVISDMDGDYLRTTAKITLKELINKILTNGEHIMQGYIKPAKLHIKDELGIDLGFKPKSIRLRRQGASFYLTCKEKTADKENPREVEYKITSEIFIKYWPLTAGSVIRKVRLTEEKGDTTIMWDVFTDRYLVMAEIEADSFDKVNPAKPLSTKEVTGQSEWSNRSLSL